MDDPQRYRVNLICPCKNDLAYGYGPTVEQARENARRFFRREHKRQRPAEEIVERVSADGTHYEEVA